jgi:formylmethanofuran dehydrogenase subunit E
MRTGDLFELDESRSEPFDEKQISFAMTPCAACGEVYADHKRPIGTGFRKLACPLQPWRGARQTFRPARRRRA